MPRTPVCWGRACPESLEGLEWGWTPIPLLPRPCPQRTRVLLSAYANASRSLTAAPLNLLLNPFMGTEPAPYSIRGPCPGGRFWPVLSAPGDFPPPPQLRIGRFVRTFALSRGYCHFDHSSLYCTGKAPTCLETASTQRHRRVGDVSSTGRLSYEVRQNETVPLFSR